MTRRPAAGESLFGSGGGAPHGGGTCAGAGSPGRSPCGSVPSTFTSFSGWSASASTVPAGRNSPTRSVSLETRGTTNCPLPHSPGMHSGAPSATSSARPAPTQHASLPKLLPHQRLQLGGNGRRPASALLRPDHPAPLDDEERKIRRACVLRRQDREQTQRGEEHPAHRDILPRGVGTPSAQGLRAIRQA